MLYYLIFFLFRVRNFRYWRGGRVYRVDRGGIERGRGRGVIRGIVFDCF